jgi:hypothetical protein
MIDCKYWLYLACHLTQNETYLTQLVLERSTAQIVEEIRLGALVADRYVGVRACEERGKRNSTAWLWRNNGLLVS